MSAFFLGMGLLVFLLSILGVAAFFVSKQNQKKDAVEEKASTVTTVVTPDTDKTTTRRRTSNAPTMAATDGTPSQPQLNVSAAVAESRRPSFSLATSPTSPLPSSSVLSPTERRNFATLPSSTTGSSESRRSNLNQPQPPIGNTSPPQSANGSEASSPRTLRKQASRTVSFHSEVAPAIATTSNLGFPPVTPLAELEGHVDAVESAAFSEDGLLATGGGPDDVYIRIYNRGVGTVGTVRHNINVQKDCGKHDGPSVLNFAQDEGKKSTLLLVGTRSERFLMGYKVSKSAATHPLMVFTFETKHGSPLIGVTGFIPKEAINFFDPGVYLATCARGTREVKIWTAKGHPLFVLDCECWTTGLRLEPSGKHLAVLSSGGGPGVMLEIKQDKHHHLKFAKTKLSIPIDASASPTSPHVTSRRSVVGDLAYQASQDLIFQPDGGASLLCCRVDVALSLAHVTNVESATQWELETLIRPESLLTASPTHICLLVPKTEGRQTRVLVSRGKHLFFFDASLGLLGVLEGRREDGDVIGASLSPKADFVVVVSFGASVARIVTIT